MQAGVIGVHHVHSANGHEIVMELYLAAAIGGRKTLAHCLQAPEAFAAALPSFLHTAAVSEGAWRGDGRYNNGSDLSS